MISRLSLVLISGWIFLCSWLLTFVLTVIRYFACILDTHRGESSNNPIYKFSNLNSLVLTSLFGSEHTRVYIQD